jgi:carboxylesterase
VSAPAAQTRVAVDPAPFDLGGGRDAVLCLHGLTGTPYEVRPLGEAMAGRGLRAVGLLLPGHGGGPEALAASRCEDWLAEVGRVHRELCSEHERVAVVGLSLGGLLALALAAETRVDALGAMGTPLRMRSRARWLLPVARLFSPMIPKRGGSDIRDPAARARHPSMSVMPAASIRQLIRLQRRVRAGLPRVTAPILVAHGRLDATAHPADARRILRGVASPERELLWLPNSGHVLPVDYDGPLLARVLGDFLARPRAALRYVAGSESPGHRRSHGGNR